MTTDFDSNNGKNFEDVYRNVLREIGEDTEREGLVRTPHRAAEAMKVYDGRIQARPENNSQRCHFP